MSEVGENHPIKEMFSVNPDEQALMEKFPEDTTVKVQRSDGRIEDGWRVVGFMRKSQTQGLRAKLTKPDPDRIDTLMTKSVLLTDLEELNK